MTYHIAVKVSFGYDAGTANLAATFGCLQVDTYNFNLAAYDAIPLISLGCIPGIAFTTLNNFLITNPAVSSGATLMHS